MYNVENGNSYTVILREAAVDLDFSNLSEEESYQVVTNKLVPLFLNC